MTAQERAAALEAEAAALDAKVSQMSREVFGMESKIKAAILEDEQRAKQLVRQRAKLGEEIDLFRFKSAAIRDQLVEMHADLLRERLDEAREVFTAKQKAMMEAGARVERLRMELDSATREHHAALGQASNAGEIVARLESELRTQ